MLPDCDQSAVPGTLYVVASPIGNLHDLTPRAAAILSSVSAIAAEDTRVSKKLLSHMSLEKPLIPYHEQNESVQTAKLIQQLQSGDSIALLSDAGTPAISDPGFRLTRACHNSRIPVVPIPGPVAFAAALSASGLPSNGLLYLGFLPPKSAARVKFFSEHKSFPYTIALYESSHRIEKFLNNALEVLGPERVICLARELTKRHETIITGNLAHVMDVFNKHSKKGEFTVLIAPESFSL